MHSKEGTATPLKTTPSPSLNLTAKQCDPLVVGFVTATSGTNVSLRDVVVDNGDTTEDLVDAVIIVHVGGVPLERMYRGCEHKFIREELAPAHGNREFAYFILGVGAFAHHTTRYLAPREPKSVPHPNLHHYRTTCQTSAGRWLDVSGSAC